MTHPAQRGFTLIELAIVLVIIGLIAAGVLSAQTMIRTAQLRGAISEYDAHLKAIKEFQDKYLALPGDMNNAEAQWGSDTTCPGTAYNNVPKKQTCNGDGSGTIGSSDQWGGISHPEEWFRAWQQLADAGFTPGLYTGVHGSGSLNEAVPGQNVPSSKLEGAGWTLVYMLMIADGVLYGDQYGHILMLGGKSGLSYARGPVLVPDEALSIDSKIDDGKPGTGKVRTWRTAVMPNCTTNDTSQDAQTYNNAADARNCSLIFLLGY